MSTQITPKPSDSRIQRRNTIAAGVLLVAAGAGLLVFQQLNIIQYFFLVLGLAFMALGILTHTSGWMIPGGIVGGLGFGFLMMEVPFTSAVPSLNEGGIFLLCFGAGFASITLFTRLFGEETHTWALIPGGIMGLIGALVLLQEPGLKVLEIIGKYFWPVGLIAAGLLILFKVVRKAQ